MMSCERLKLVLSFVQHMQTSIARVRTKLVKLFVQDNAFIQLRLWLRWMNDRTSPTSSLATLQTKRYLRGLVDFSFNSPSMETKDCNGNILSQGDSVTVIKTLKVKGSPLTIKQGQTIKNIKLTDDPDEVDCKVDGSSIVLRTEFLRKK